MTKSPSKTAFLKMHGAGNDFVIIDARKKNLKLSTSDIRVIASKNNRITNGCDQLIVIENGTDCDALMRIYNTDGSVAGACGNATRCIGWLILQETGKEVVKIATNERGLTCKEYKHNFNANLPYDAIIEADMGSPVFAWEKIPLSSQFTSEELLQVGKEAGVQNLEEAFAVGMGNPHIVFFVKNGGAKEIEKVGSNLQTHELFHDGINVTIASIIGKNEIQSFVFERGVGITASCGTASCATAVAAVKIGYCEYNKDIKLNIGSGKEARQLLVRYQDNDKVFLIGPVKKYLEGVFDIF